jgi:hypothetical protein
VEAAIANRKIETEMVRLWMVDAMGMVGNPSPLVNDKIIFGSLILFQ